MKKLITALFIIGAVSTGFAQSSRQYPVNRRDEARDVILGQENRTVYNNDRRNDSYYYSANEREMQIRQINREFDARIGAVGRDRYLRNSERNRQIKMLERQRAEQIRQLNDRSNNRRSRYDDRYNGNRRY